MGTTVLATISAGVLKCHRIRVGASKRGASIKRYGRHTARWCSVSSSSRGIRASSRGDDSLSPMEIWPGVSSPLDFEFGYEILQEEKVELDEIERIAGFSELKDAMLQPYMGDVDMLEEEESPAKYVPPPPIPLEEVEMRNKAEEVMYTLLHCVPGPIAVLLDDRDKWDTLVQMFSEAVEIQDPLICLKGVHRFKRLVKVLCRSGIRMDLHEVYYENVAADRFKRWVYAVWTATLTNNLEESVEKSNLTEWWESAYGSLVEKFSKREDAARSANAEEKWKPHHVLKLSGESKFEVNEAGEVTSVSSRWYKLTEQDDIELAASKLWLAGLYSRGL